MSATQELSVIINANIAEFRNAMNDVGDSVRQAGDQVRDSMDGAESSASSGASGIKSALKGIAGTLAAAFALDKIKDFGVSLVESAADAQAMTAQFEQVFGELQPEATKAIDGMGKEFGMVGSRIKPAFTQMTSLFKGLGLDSEAAMDGASRAMTASADAAAFYDVSMEDASSALTSFMKGNWEAGESIGLFANEAQMASYASDTLGKDYKTLDEAGKQLVRLSFAESMQESAGAMGQASRESGSYSNQLGNLKQMWTDLKGQLGQPILAVAIAGIKKLSEFVGQVDATAILDGFKTFGDYMVTVFKPTVDDVKNVLQALWDKFKESGGIEAVKGIFEGFKEVLLWIKDNTGVVTAVLGGLAGAFIAFNIITGISTAIKTFNILMAAMRAGTLAATLAQYGLNTAMLLNPFTWIAVAIGALIAVGILLYKNWDEVSAFLTKTWAIIKAAASVAWEGLKAFLAATWESIKTGALAAWEGIKNFLSAAWNGIKAVGEAVFNGIKAYFTFVFNVYKTIIMSVWNGIKSFLSAVWDGIKTLATTAFNNIKNNLTTILNGIKSVMTTVWNAIKSFITTTLNSIKNTAINMWNTIKSTITGIINNIKSTVTSIFNNIKSTLTNIWTSIKSAVVNTVEALRSSIVSKFNSAKNSATTIFNNIKSAMTKPVDAARDAIKRAIDKIKGFFSGLKLKFPKISMPKMPSFSLTGKFSLAPPSVPKVGINWNAKGGVFNKPTVFNTANAGMQGVGEAGSEAIIPLSRRVLGGIGKGIAKTMPNDKKQGSYVEIQSLINIENFNGTKAEKDSLAKDIISSLSKIGVRVKR